MSVLNGETTWRIHDQAESALLIDGRDYFRAFYAAARTARRSILLLGWQFDSDVELLRGDDLPTDVAPEDVQLLSLLERLSRERQDLETRVLAWNHSVFFALERELLQKLYFDMVRSERFFFRWDDTVPLGGSHHQKVAIIDGRIAFLGSQDICQSRWDDSSHRPDNPHRTARGAPYCPYHEVQLAVTGEPARSLVDLFVSRWHAATGERLDPETLVAGAPNGRGPAGFVFPVTLPMPPARVALARTVPEVIGRPHVDEVNRLHVRAILEARRLIYVETQYFTSCAVRDALLERMRDRSRPKLEIVIVLPRRPEGFKEMMTVGIPQIHVLQALDQAARRHGHALGVYDVVVGTDEDGEPMHVHIHSKLMIVDDRVFIVGSANLTNRSMMLDSEIVAAYEARDGRAEDRALANAIRRARVRLILEHAGGGADARTVVRHDGLVARLDALAARGGRIVRHPIDGEPPGLLKKAVHEIAFEFLDPRSGPLEGPHEPESCPPTRESSAVVRESSAVGPGAVSVGQPARAR